MDEIERIREVARELINQGHPGLAHKLFEIATRLETGSNKPGSNAMFNDWYSQQQNG